MVPESPLGSEKMTPRRPMAASALLELRDGTPRGMIRLARLPRLVLSKHQGVQSFVPGFAHGRRYSWTIGCFAVKAREKLARGSHFVCVYINVAVSL